MAWSTVLPSERLHRMYHAPRTLRRRQNRTLHGATTAMLATGSFDEESAPATAFHDSRSRGSHGLLGLKQRIASFLQSITLPVPTNVISYLLPSEQSATNSSLQSQASAETFRVKSTLVDPHGSVRPVTRQQKEQPLLQPFLERATQLEIHYASLVSDLCNIAYEADREHTSPHWQQLERHRLSLVTNSAAPLQGPATRAAHWDQVKRDYYPGYATTEESGRQEAQEQAANLQAVAAVAAAATANSSGNPNALLHLMDAIESPAELPRGLSDSPLIKYSLLMHTMHSMDSSEDSLDSMQTMLLRSLASHDHQLATSGPVTETIAPLKALMANPHPPLPDIEYSLVMHSLEGLIEKVATLQESDSDSDSEESEPEYMPAIMPTTLPTHAADTHTTAPESHPSATTSSSTLLAWTPPMYSMASYNDDPSPTGSGLDEHFTTQQHLPRSLAAFEPHPNTTSSHMHAANSSEVAEGQGARAHAGISSGEAAPASADRGSRSRTAAAGQGLLMQPVSPSAWFVADDPATKVRYCIIQGSTTLDHWAINVNCEPVTFEDPVLGFRVHKGVYEAAVQLLDDMLPVVLQHLASSPSATVSFGGHSLGGSLATVVMLLLVHRGHIPPSRLSHCYTFGAPAVFATAGRTAEQAVAVDAGAAVARDPPRQRSGSRGSRNQQQPLLAQLGIPEEMLVNVMMHKDIVPRAFACDLSATPLGGLLRRWVPSLSSAMPRNSHHHKSLFTFLGKIQVIRPDDAADFVLGDSHHPMLPDMPGLYKLSDIRHIANLSGSHTSLLSMDGSLVHMDPHMDPDGSTLCMDPRMDEDVNHPHMDRHMDGESQGHSHQGWYGGFPASGLNVSLHGAQQQQVCASKAAPASLRRAMQQFMNEPHPLECLSLYESYGPNGTISRFHNPNNYTKGLRGLLSDRQLSKTRAL